MSHDFFEHENIAAQFPEVVSRLAKQVLFNPSNVV